MNDSSVFKKVKQIHTATPLHCTFVLQQCTLQSIILMFVYLLLTFRSGIFHLYGDVYPIAAKKLTDPHPVAFLGEQH
jgi:hypothetical protein